MKAYLYLILCCLPFSAFAIQKAITDQGDVVILNDDGTWQYETNSTDSIPKIAENPQPFSKPDSNSFLVKSSHNSSAYWINPKKWAFKKEENGHESAEYTFQLKGKDLYAMAITEEVEIGLEELTDVAVNNARSAASSLQVTKREYRQVNGHRVIYMEMEGRIQGMDFTYLGYYFSNEKGSTQFLAYTGTKLVDKYRDAIDDMLNGFTLQ